jgi:hypothetical protein
MAKIKKDRLNESASAEMQVTITGTSSGAAYKFVLKRRHIEVEQISLTQDSQKSHAKGKKTDWFTTLTDEEKTQVFALILDEYRNRSLGDNGFKGASIGVANEREAGQSRLFIGTNTTRWASPYFKHCAEQNMVNAATDTLMYERSLKPESTQGKPRAPKFKVVYVLQAVDEHTTPVSCPCGKCIDMLRNVMNEDGEVVTVPFLTDVAKQKIKTDTNAVIINKTAKTLDEIPLPAGRETYEVWSTPIAALNRNRTITLEGRAATLQRDALNTYLPKLIARDESLPQARATEEIGAMSTQILKTTTENLPSEVTSFVDAFIHSVRSSSKLISQKIRNLVTNSAEPAKKAAENELTHRHSVAALDCAISGGHIDLKALNQFMVTRITDTISDRLRCDPGYKEMSQIQVRDWLKKHIQSVRCVAIQLDDGTFRYAVQADSAYDKAMPNAEVAALEQATESLGQHGVRHLWAMEMNPADIHKGDLRTSPKEGIERLMKRASTKIDFHYLPFNSGTCSNEVLRKMLVNLDAEELYPSSFKGAEVAHSRQHIRPKTWAAHITQVKESAQHQAIT